MSPWCCRRRRGCPDPGPGATTPCAPRRPSGGCPSGLRRGVQRLPPGGQQSPTVIMPIGVMRAGEVGIVSLPPDPQRGDVESVFRASLVSPLGHQHRLHGLEVVVLRDERIDQLDALPCLNRIEVEPLLPVDEAGGVGRGVGLHGDEVGAFIAFAQPGGQLPQDGNVLRLGLGHQGPDDVGHLLVASRQPPRPVPRVPLGDELAPA